MALWRIETVGDRITLTVRECPPDLTAPPDVRGTGSIEHFDEAERWLVEQLSPWDLMEAPRGTFIRQVPPEYVRM